MSQTRILTGSNVDSIKKTQVSEAQEAYVKAVDRSNKTMARKIDKDSITPVNNNIIIKCKLHQSLIAMPGGKAQGEVEYIEIYKVSEKVKNTQPEIKPGMKCSVNIQLILATGGSPCYEDETENGAFVYFRVSAEQVDYLYDFK